MAKIKKALIELLSRLRLAVTILLFGDLINGNIKHLRAMLAEMEYVATHQEDMEKAEIVSLIVGEIGKPHTGVLHHIRHVLTSQNWRIIAAEMREAELLDAKRRVMEILDGLRKEDG